MEEKAYSFLPKKIMKCIYEKRKSLDPDIKYNTRIEKVENGAYVEIWFLTQGCRWDAEGGCTICNYGKGCKISNSTIIQAIRDAIHEVDTPIGELAITPSGSFLDDEEVPLEVRSQIYQLVNESDAHTFLFETRAQTITEKKIKELTESVKDKKLVVEIGLETSDFFIQKYCINKGYFLKEYEKAVSILKKNNVYTYANVILGTPFLNRQEARKDCKRTIEWALSKGTDKVVLFPLHVKPGTMLEWLYKNSLYEPISLWGLVDVLDSLKEEHLSRIEISWYKNYYTEKSKIIASPDTCHNCYDDIILLLDKFRENPKKSVVEELKEYSCECKKKWGNATVSDVSLVDRIKEQYSIMTKDLLGQDIWDANGQIFCKELEKDFEKYHERIYW